MAYMTICATSHRSRPLERSNSTAQPSGPNQWSHSSECWELHYASSVSGTPWTLSQCYRCTRGTPTRPLLAPPLMSSTVATDWWSLKPLPRRSICLAPPTCGNSWKKGVLAHYFTGWSRAARIHLLIAAVRSGSKICVMTASRERILYLYPEILKATILSFSFD